MWWDRLVQRGPQQCKTGIKPATERRFQRRIAALDERCGNAIAVLRQIGEIGSGTKGNSK